MTWAVIAVTGAGLVSRCAAPRQRGEALGMYTALAGIGGGIGGLLGGYGASVVGYQLTFGLAGGVVQLGVVVLVSIRFGFAAGGEPSVT